MPMCKKKNLSREKIYEKHGLKTTWVNKTGSKVILPVSKDNPSWKQIEKITK